MTKNPDAQLFSSKHFWEEYALKSLPYCGFNTTFIKSEEPDLQDAINSIGIEVVQVLQKSEGHFRAIWNQYAGTGISSNQFAKHLTIPELKGKVIPNLPGMAAILSEGDGKELIQSTISTIATKAKKFEHYTKFKRNGLYLFHDLLFPVQIDDLKKEILASNFPFDFYIINLQGDIFVIDIKNKDVISYAISPEQRKALTDSALDTARRKINKIDKSKL